MPAKTRRLLTFIGLFVIVCLGVIFFLKSRSDKAPSVSYPVKESIQNELKITVQPLSLEKGKDIQFFVSMESYEHKELSTLDMKESGLLVNDAQTPTKPSGWEPDQKSAYKTDGILTFPKQHDDTSSYTLFIFALEERSFTWQL